jgi:hypothetical protein
MVPLSKKIHLAHPPLMKKNARHADYVPGIAKRLPWLNNNTHLTSIA